MRPRLAIMLAVAIAAAVLAFAFADRLAELNPGQIGALIASLMALTLVAGGYFAARRPGYRTHPLRDALIWAAVIVGLVLLFPLIAPALPERFGLR